MVVISNNFEAPVDGVILATPGIKLIVNDQVYGTGTLYITQDNVVWGDGVTPGGTFASTVSLLYPTISLHAIQREPTASLYLQLSYDLDLPGLQQAPASDESPDGEEEGEDDDFEEDVQPVSQLRFVPENEHLLQEMYNALTAGQSLHPDPVLDQDDFYMGEGGEGDEDEDEDDPFEDAEESSAEQTASRLQNLHLSKTNGHQENGNGTEHGTE